MSLHNGFLAVWPSRYHVYRHFANLLDALQIISGCLRELRKGFDSYRAACPSGHFLIYRLTARELIRAHGQDFVDFVLPVIASQFIPYAQA
jgi:hypothetical protein